MAYDPDSWQAKKGKLGEDIVKSHFECYYNWIVEKPADTFESGASIIDFEVSDGESEFFAEVKV